VFGYNEIVIGLLFSYFNDKNNKSKFFLKNWLRYFFRTKYIVVVEKDVSKVKDEIVGVLGRRANLYVLHGSRSSKEDLKKFHIKKAKEIFMIGEDEQNADVLNLQSLHLISSIVKDSKKNRNIFLYNANNGRFCSWDNCSRFLPQQFLDSSFLKIIDSDELCINNILGDPDNNWPNYKIHKRSDVDVINWQSDKKVHLVIFGMNSISNKVIKSASNFAHFPNHYTKKINTLITVIDSNIGDASFVIDPFKVYFDYCKFEIKRIKDGRIISDMTHNQVDDCDFVDIDFEFIESEPDNPCLNDYIKTCATDRNQYISIYTCLENFNDCFETSIQLPKEVYDYSIPIWMYSKKTTNLSQLLNEKYMNIIPWGNPGEQCAFSNWDRERTTAMCALFKNYHTNVAANRYYQTIYDYVSFLPILHTSTLSFENGSPEETKSLISAEYNRNCVASLFNGERKVTSIFVTKELCEKGYAQTEICNFEDLPKVVRHYYLTIVEDLGLGIFQGKEPKKIKQ
jgi:hypothetical protein